MRWSEVRQQFPHRWLIVEAVDARSELDRRQVDELAVVDAFPTGEAALRTYLKLHRLAPGRELYVLHTDREELDIEERRRSPSTRSAASGVWEGPSSSSPSESTA